jgi:hypothetical protein
MANGFTLDSEQLQQSPQQQQLAAQQPAPAQAQGGGFNLLDILSGIGNVIAETGAYYAASQGRPQLLQAMQEREQQQNLLQQLQSISKQEMEGPFGGALSQALNIGDLQGAQKIVSNIPKYRELEKTLPELDLSEAERQSVKAIGALDPQIALDLTKRIIGEKAVLGRQKEVVATTEAAKLAREERKLAREAQKRPGPVLAKGFKEGVITPDDIPGQIAYLESQGIDIPLDENKARLKLSRAMASVEVRPFIAEKDQRSWIQQGIDYVMGRNQPAAAPMAPAAPQLPGAVRKFNPATGRLE